MIQIIPIPGIPIVKPGDDIIKIVFEAVKNNPFQILDGDIIVIAHKIVSRATGRLINLENVRPGRKALKIAGKMEEDPRKIQVILNESNRIIKSTAKHLITENKLGFVCANAGVDRSNSYQGEYLILPPVEPDKICEDIRKSIEENLNVKVGVIISDTHGRALRKGAVGVCLGVAGIPALLSYKGRRDIFGYELKVTEIAIVDEIASAAELVIGESNERTPIALIRGLKLPSAASTHKDLIYKPEERLFY
ncbi:MAG: coenzyme F420-0:L-glutamate ligase [Candidatus Odinarchaeum yellowstonii]|uniref:Coenzyme F420-0:L-glutamate ligase n=1 Tax=Odinarchaeota yellowstonii (strain LCB_4) TaxID=1841599 RepID=A0AAF0D162_ODILC|nr:MAG: coenzyme F420-0:L-glutamate ligase [Candidatus Odinarchaeum yellowstonii]